MHKYLVLRGSSMTNRERGFTILELLVVIIVLGILSTIGVGVYQSQRGRAHDAATISDVRNMATAVEASDKWMNTGKAPTYTDLTADGAKSSPNVIWGVSGANGGYFIVGYNSSGKKYTTESNELTYDSLAGGLGKTGGACRGDTYVGSVTVRSATAYNVYSCPDGGTLNTDANTCDTPASSYAASGYNTYSCSGSDTLAGTTCNISALSYAATSTRTATGGYYSCDSGDTRSGSTCTNRYTSTQSATYHSAVYGSYYCRSPQWGYKLVYNYYGKDGHTAAGEMGSVYSGYGCVQELPDSTKPWGYTWGGYWPADRDVTAAYYSCPSGYSLSGSTCSKTITSTYYADYTTTYTTTYSCPSGGSLGGTTCSRAASSYAAAVTNNFTCSSGDTLVGETCNSAAKSYVATVTKNYKCPSTDWTLDVAARTCTRSD